MLVLDVLLTAAVSFIITFLAIPIILQVAEKKNLYDIPDERKVHTNPVASLGGVGIFAGFLLASPFIYPGVPESRVPVLFCSSFGHFFPGAKGRPDDIVRFQKIHWPDHSCIHSHSPGGCQAG
jgi:UDP-N-acetylmuramyl pentapeptide phosphotransferase/UDP-N-acetylglucosamine-1-phosphate transferase